MQNHLSDYLAYEYQKFNTKVIWFFKADLIQVLRQTNQLGNERIKQHIIELNQQDDAKTYDYINHFSSVETLINDLKQEEITKIDNNSDDTEEMTQAA